METTYSPVLGIITAAFELSVAAWVILFHRRNKTFLAAAGVLFFLAGYQILEVVICYGKHEDFLFLSRLAFIDVTWLPPLSILLVARLFKSRTKAVYYYAYASFVLAVLFSFWILVDFRFVSKTICEVMYSKYIYLEPYFHIYGAFYEITQISIALVPVICMIYTDSIRDRRNLADVSIGGMIYLFSAFILAIAVPEINDKAMPSVMCHTALFYAIFIFKMMLRESKADQPR